ncbi:hypothetical protein [Streptomyces sp. NPDC053560]|uniref:hypothetical protein n=1 Tax=Streptomyces sp. NPDC053560 TaxID=3365711 RepID=UPI0037D97697
MLWRRWSRAVIAVGAVSVLALSASGCGGPAGRASAEAGIESARATAAPAGLRPLTQKDVGAALLSPGDLPQGWSTTEEDLTWSEEPAGIKDDLRADDPNCERAVAQSHHNARTTGGGSRKLDNSATGSAFMTGLSIYGSERGARQDLETARQLRRYCTAEAGVKDHTEDGTYDTSYGVLSAPERGDETVGVRMKINGTRIDEYLIRIGPNVVNVTLFNDTGDDRQLVEDLTAQAVEKVRQAAH